MPKSKNTVISNRDRFKSLLLMFKEKANQTNILRIKYCENGQEIVELALILALVSLVVIGIMQTIGNHLNTTTVKVNKALNTVNQNVNTTGNST